MRHSDMVAFGGGRIERAAHLRENEGSLRALLASGRVLPMWRGKPLVSVTGGLIWVDADHPILKQAELSLFLGLEGEVAHFAADISRWEPMAQAIPHPSLFHDPSEQQHPAMPEGFVFAELRMVMMRLSAEEAEFAATARALLQWHKSHGFCAACGERSEPAQAGWQRLCPVCRTQHFPRTDPVVIMLVTRGNAALLGRSPGWPAGMFSCLAGFMEPGETIEAAVRREVLEETGIRVGKVRYLASQPWPFPTNLMIGCHGEALSEEIVVDPNELEQAIWVSREEMVAVLTGEHPLIRPPRKGAIAQFLIQNWLADRLK